MNMIMPITDEQDVERPPAVAGWADGVGRQHDARADVDLVLAIGRSVSHSQRIVASTATIPLRPAEIIGLHRQREEEEGGEHRRQRTAMATGRA